MIGHVSKALTPVRIELSSGEIHDGGLYLSKGERLQDMLNAVSPFVPFRMGPRLLMLGKAQIVSVELLPG